MKSIREQLKQHEGLRLRPYRCPAGRLTIGYGHNCEANPLPEHIGQYLAEHGCITEKMADELLDRDIFNAVKDCRKLYPAFDAFLPPKQNALIDMIFNLGYSGLRKFTTTNLFINAGRWRDAAENLKRTKWYGQVGNRAKTICKMLTEA